jgi:hypothetical protein
MSSFKQRIDRYVSAVTLPAIAVGGGGVAFTNIAEADIVYESVSLTFGGPLNGPDFNTLDMGFGSIKFLAGTNSTGPEAFMGAKGNNEIALLVNGSGKSLSNFSAGESISLVKSNKPAFVGVGAKVGTTGSKGKGSGKTVSKGAWALGSEDSVSGYMGFAFFNNDGFGEGVTPNYGWVSMSWDGAYLTIDGYAIETDVGTAIQAGAIPAPGAIGLLGLAAGAAGMRRKRQA